MTFRVKSGPALISTDSVIATNVGQVVILAEQAGDAHNAPASALRTFNERTVSVRQIGACDIGGSAYDIQAVGNRAYVTVYSDGSDGLVILDVTDPAQPVLLGKYAAFGARNVRVVGNLAYLTAQEDLQILDTTDPGNIRRLGGYDQGGYGINVEVAGKFAYLTDAPAGLQVLDISDPANIRTAGNYQALTPVTGGKIAGNIAYATDLQFGFLALDVENPANIIHLGDFAATGVTGIPEVKANTAYLACGYYGLEVLDVTDPKVIKSLSQNFYDPSRAVLAVRVVDSTAYVGELTTGLQVLDVLNPSDIQYLGGYQTPGQIISIAAVGNVAYVGTEKGGLLVLEIRPEVKAKISASSPIPPGTELFLTSEVTGEGPATFQWFLNGDPLAGETNVSLHLPEVSAATAGDYTLQVTSASQQVRSDPVTIHLPFPEIVQQLTNLGVAFGVSNSLSIVAVGLPDPGYQWRQDGKLLEFQTNSVLPLMITNLADLGSYDVVVSNPYGTLTSSVARVTLLTNLVEFTTNALSVNWLQGALLLPIRRTGSYDGLELPVEFGGDASLGVDFSALTEATVETGADLGSLSLQIIDVPDAHGSKTLTVTLKTDGLPDVLLGANRTLNLTFTNYDQIGLDGAPYAILPLPDGRILVGGAFTNAGGISRPSLVRLQPDLSVDPTFSPPSLTSSNPVSHLAVQPDGGILVHGAFPNKVAKSRILRRLFPDGSEDDGFTALEGDAFFYVASITNMVSDGSGRLLLWGNFSTGIPSLMRSVIRLLPDGSRDPAFAANFADSWVAGGGSDVARLRDGRMIVVGSFGNPFGATNRSRIAGLTSDGSFNDSFFTGAGFNSPAYAAAADNQDRILVSGSFFSFGGTPASSWVRLNQDGSRDSTFQPTYPAGEIVQMQVLPGGEIITRFRNGQILLFADDGTLLRELAHGCTVFSVEPSGNLLVGMSNPPRVVRLDAPKAPVSRVELIWGSITVGEGASGIQVPLRRTGPVQTAAQVTYQIQAGSAVAGVDFQATNGQIQFGPGISEVRLTIPLTAQNLTPNDDRTILVTLDSANGTTLDIGRTNCVVTLEDDDTGLTAEIFASQTPNEQSYKPLVSGKNYFLHKLDQHRDAEVYFEWDGTAPRGSSNDYFAIIWTGWLVPEVTGQYTLSTYSDDGVRLWLDGKLIVSNWRSSSATIASSPSLQLEAGKPYRLVLDYFEDYGNASSRLLWLPPGGRGAVPIPRRVLRPGGPAFTPPSISGTSTNGFQITYASEAGRPLTLQTSTNGTDWKFLREAVSAVEGVTNFFSANSVEMLDVVLLRAISLDGLLVTNALPPLVRVNGSTREYPVRLLAHETNGVSLSVPTPADFGQSIAWLHDGERVASGSPLIISGSDPGAAGNYQAVVTYPFGQVTSNLKQISLVEPDLPVISTQMSPVDGSLLIHVQTDNSVLDQTVRLDVSTDLQHWETLASGLISLDFALPASAGPAQFFRAVVE